MSTISQTITQQVTLSPGGTYSSPLTITSAGAVLYSGNGAVVGPILQVGGRFVTWTLSNFGTITGGSSTVSGSAVVFESGGSITNGQGGSSGGVISGTFAGVNIIGSGYPNNVTNFGIINGGVAGIAIKNAGDTSIINGASGTGGSITGGSLGISVTGGGGNFTVTNFGAIQGGGTHSIFGYGFGVSLGGLSGTVANYGSITVAGTASIGVYIDSTAVLTNGGNGAAAALIRGARGVFITNGVGTVSNFGAIVGTAGAGVNIGYGGVGVSGILVNGGPGAPGASITGTRDGVEIGGVATVTNFGSISASGTATNGVLLGKSGSVLNSGTITGSEFGIQFVFTAGLSPGTVRNLGTIAATATAGAVGDGVAILPGGTVVNGQSNSTGGLITGGQNGVRGANTVANYGNIIGAAGYGAGLTSGSILNAGLVQGGSGGIRFTGTAGTVLNVATVGGGSGVGIYVAGSGLVLSGQTGTTTARVSGGTDGIRINGSAGIVINFATVIGTSGFGLRIGGSTTAASSVINGPSGATSAVITGGIGGVRIDGAGTVANFATIIGTAVGAPGSGAGVFVGAGGAVSNGALGTTGASILGASAGVRFYNNGVGTVTNFATIVASATNGAGVELDKGGSVVNGASNSTTALIYGGLNGIVKATTVTNYATIIGVAGYGVGLSSGILVNAARGLIQGSSAGIRFNGTAASLVNFGTIIGTAISGGIGVYVGPTGSTVTNAGTIIGLGQGGTAIQFAAANARLIADPGAVFAGKVVGAGNSAGNTIELAAGAGVGTLSGLGTSIVNFGSVVLDASAAWRVVIADTNGFTGTISGFVAGDSIDLPFQPFDSSGSALLGVNNQLRIVENGGTVTINLDASQNFSGKTFQLSADAAGGTLVTETPPPSQSPPVLNDFGWAQGWGSPNNPRLVIDINSDGTTDYLGFGFSAVFVAYGGTFADAQGQRGPSFSGAVPAVQDFGTNEGYTAQVQRGAAATGAGVGDVLYGQGFAGVYWYAATSATPQTDAAGHTYNVLNYQNSPNLYGNFGSQQGWSPDNGFQILKANASDPFASILGFGNDGIVVGPQAFAPGATAANSYLLPLAAGNNSGWKQSVDIRTFTDAKGNTIDLNHDGIADFVGMGPQGLVYALGNNIGPGGGYGLGALQTAHISGGNTDLGEAQGWTDSATLRYVVADPQTGFDDILAFGAPGVFVSMGQDPATHNGEPFGQLYLAMPDFGSNQGWSVDKTPRIVGDVNGDGIPDIVGFGATSTFVAIGARDAAGNLHFALDPSMTIGDFGYTEGWSGTNPQTVRALADFKIGGATHSDLVLSGAFNTQVWQFT